MEKTLSNDIPPEKLEAMRAHGVPEDHIKDLIEKFGIKRTMEYIDECLKPKHLDQDYGKPDIFP